MQGWREGGMEGGRDEDGGVGKRGGKGEGRGRRTLVKVILLTALLLGLVWVHGGGLLLVVCVGGVWVVGMVWIWVWIWKCAGVR